MLFHLFNGSTCEICHCHPPSTQLTFKPDVVCCESSRTDQMQRTSSVHLRRRITLHTGTLEMWLVAWLCRRFGWTAWLSPIDMSTRTVPVQRQRSLHTGRLDLRRRSWLRIYRVGHRHIRRRSIQMPRKFDLPAQLLPLSGRIRLSSNRPTLWRIAGLCGSVGRRSFLQKCESVPRGRMPARVQARYFRPAVFLQGRSTAKWNGLHRCEWMCHRRIMWSDVHQLERFV